ncbi:PAS domain S-box protein [Phytoactinopolyspora alkaliphila]|uniref:histidine kinase n=1 Tax=Phytoactinopolyspora alkaliphila TaxID=1783498 RepID=A0A6N9YRN5_9ACTN|nr:PAS domain S-box protein [Phytoactinopolyspora alkaliphila]NED97726.1 PAS domain S-box protein [Phytoactinopolyspora alkaliphila]
MGKHTPTIVVIDDSAEVRSLIKARLRLSGLLDVVADGSDGAEAVGLAYQHEPDLLLLDMSMPTMDGLDALRGILAVSPDTRVIVYSGFDGHGIAERARELGAVAFFEKSVPVDELAGKIMAVWSSAESRKSGTTPPPQRRLAVVNEAAQLPDDLRQNDEQNIVGEHLERFREVFDGAAIGMAVMTLTGSIVRANRALGALIQAKHEDLVGLDYGVLTSGRGDELDAALREVNENDTDLVHIEHDVGTGSEVRKVLATLAPVRDSRGQALYVFLQVQDITAQRAAEDELRLSEERFRLLVEAVGDYAIFMLDPEGHVVSWNTGAQRSKGYASDEIIGQHFRVFYGPEDQARRHPEEELEIALREGRYEEEGWRLRKDGGRFWANVLITAVFNEAGEHIGFAKVTRDTTERKMAEQERERVDEALRAANTSLEKLNDRLRQAAADQAQYLAVIAHELRTPATVLGGSADTLSKHWSEMSAGEVGELLDGMAASAGRLRRLLSDLLIVSRLEANSLQLKKVPTNLSTVVENTADSARTANPGAEILVEMDTDVEAMTDPDRVAQALDNLIGNALRYGASPVRVTLRQEGGMAVIRVADEGRGVAPELQPRLFERFATGMASGGTGLGLFIVRELARAHGGDAAYEPGTVENPAGAFVFSIPLG